MSRCFPFPPPGYAKKTRTDDVNLLKKEKDREKKHKKEKRDKEKKGSNEKREKEGRDGKHKEKKDKKEKHREKKKDKNKDKDRDKDTKKNFSANEKGFPGQAEDPNSGKLHQKELNQTDKADTLFEEKITKQYTGNNGEKTRESNHLAEKNKDSKFLLELGRRIKDDDGGAGNQLVQRFTIADHRKEEGAVRLVAKGSGTGSAGKEKLKDKNIDVRKVDGQGIRAEAQPIRNTTGHNHAGNFHPRVDSMPGHVEKSSEGTVEATVDRKEKVRIKKDDKRGDKRKDKEEKKSHGKDKDRDKEKKKEEKVKEQTGHKNTELNKIKECNKGDPVGTNSFAQVPKNSYNNAVNGENFKKRKDIESNGVLHANDNWPSKLPRCSSSSHPAENGRILELCQISVPYASDKKEAAPKPKVDNKEGKINGIVQVQPFTVSSNKNVTVISPADAVAEASAKPPHPDSKYLSQVYSVPKMEEWLDVDDQGWLFGGSSQERKAPAESSEVGEIRHVWAEAMHIEQADVCALPYVIPY